MDTFISGSSLIWYIGGVNILYFHRTTVESFDTSDRPKWTVWMAWHRKRLEFRRKAGQRPRSFYRRIVGYGYKNILVTTSRSYCFCRVPLKSRLRGTGQCVNAEHCKSHLHIWDLYYSDAWHPFPESPLPPSPCPTPHPHLFSCLLSLPLFVSPLSPPYAW